jgi:hypothetical protein
MIYRFVVLSDEVEAFRRDILIDSEATFFELHDAILDSVGYAKDEVTSFFVCDEDWRKGSEITLIEMDTEYDVDSYVMDVTYLGDLLGDDCRRLLYVFEPLTERAFRVELRETILGRRQDRPECIRSFGAPPAQVAEFNEQDVLPPATGHVGGDVFSDEGEFGDGFDDGYNDEDFENLSEGNPWE